MNALALVLLLAGGTRTEDGSLAAPDGVELAHTVVRPDGDGPLPCLLVRTPYDRRALLGQAQELAGRGYAVVLEDCRGTGASDGTFTPFVHEQKDGARVLDWVREQPWCNGVVGTYGMSYLGITQWQLKNRAGPSQDAMVLQFTCANPYRDLVHFGGVQSLAVGLSWSLMTNRVFAPPRFRHLPLVDADDATGLDVPHWNDWSRHPRFDAYWEPLEPAGRIGELPGAALLVAGWYDLFLPGQVDDFVHLAGRSGPPEAAFARLIVGPWDHGGPGPGRGRPDLGPEAYASTQDEELAFLERFVLRRPNGYEARAGVRAFFLGENRWRELSAWPPPDARTVRLYLHGLGTAAAQDDGVLTGRPPVRDEPPDRYVCDPDDPTPSYAGNLWTPLSSLVDQAEIAQRPDVLTYATLTLPEPVTIAGPVRCRLHLRADVPDTDLAVKLVDVDPSGRQDWRGEGIQRARARGGVGTEELLVPGAVVAIDVSLGHMACTFPAGHRIGLQVAGSNFPRFARNLNTAEPSSLASAPVVAHPEILHGPDTASYLELFQVAD